MALNSALPFNLAVMNNFSKERLNMTSSTFVSEFASEFASELSSNPAATSPFSHRSYRQAERLSSPERLRALARRPAANGSMRPLPPVPPALAMAHPPQQALEAMAAMALKPLQSLVDFFSPPVAAKPSGQPTPAADQAFAPQRAPAARHAPVRKVAVTPFGASGAQNSHTVMAPKASGHVRIVRLIDAQSSPENAGRLRISGRMADVCAELERLAA
jgi:hypothetical protein